MTDLKKHTISAVKWSLIGTVGMQSVQFFITVILARLLAPAEFGLIAMLSLVMAIANSLLDSGFGSALIQKQNATRRCESSIFYFNLLMSLLMYTVLWMIAPAVARFFGEPLLIPLGRFLGVNLLINSLGLVQGVLLVKRLDFRTQAIVTTAGTLVSGSVAAIMAYGGYGVWSLAAQAVTANFVRVSLYWVLSNWRPLPTFSFSALRSMFPFGS